jgi:hypothetical protein
MLQTGNTASLHEQVCLVDDRLLHCHRILQPLVKIFFGVVSEMFNEKKQTAKLRIDQSKISKKVCPQIAVQKSLKTWQVSHRLC